MPPLALARFANMDFIGSLLKSRLPFRLIQTPEPVVINNVNYVVTREIWPFAGPDPRTFAERLMDCFQFTGILYYQDIGKAAVMADWIYLRWDLRQFFPDAPIPQEKAWASWLLADAAREAINELDDQATHVKLPTILLITLFLRLHIANILLEREQTLVDALLLRFRNIAELALLPEGDESMEITAAQTFQLKVETAGLIRAAEDLMSLSRELKEMWLSGPLRSLNEGEAETEAKIDADATWLAETMDRLVKQLDHKDQIGKDLEDRNEALGLE